jgi:hypothetical protein
MEQRSCCVCQMNDSATGNRVVQCDSCNLAIHELCHKPLVDGHDGHGQDYPAPGASTSTGWLCVSCERLRPRPRRGSTTMDSSGLSLDWEWLVPGGAHSEEDKDAWLGSLDRRTLVRFVRLLEERYPDARLYPPNLHEVIDDLRGKQHMLEDGAISEEERLDGAIAGREDTSRRERRRGRRSLRKSPSPVTATMEVGSGADATSNAAMSVGFRAASTKEASSSGAAAAANSRIDAGKLVEQGLPSYEDMIVAGLIAIGDPDGSPPRIVFEWMNEYVWLLVLVSLWCLTFLFLSVLIHSRQHFGRRRARRCKRLLREVVCSRWETATRSILILMSQRCVKLYYISSMFFPGLIILISPLTSPGPKADYSKAQDRIRPSRVHVWSGTGKAERLLLPTESPRVSCQRRHAQERPSSASEKLLIFVFSLCGGQADDGPVSNDGCDHNGCVHCPDPGHRRHGSTSPWKVSKQRRSGHWRRSCGRKQHGRQFCRHVFFAHASTATAASV